MSIVDKLSVVDAKRYESLALAKVTSSGRLRFLAEAYALMGLKDAKGVVLFDIADAPGEFGAVVCRKENEHAFPLKTSGPYKYLSLANLFVENEVDYKGASITFVISGTDDLYEGQKVFRLSRFQVPRPKKNFASKRRGLKQM